MKRAIILSLVLALVWGTVAYATAKTAGPVPSTADQVEKFSQHGIGRSLTWHTDVTSTAVDLWAAAPAEATTAVRTSAQYLIVHHCDTTDDDVPVYLRVGPAADGSPAMTTSTGVPLFVLGASFQFQIRPVEGVGASNPTDASVPIWAISGGSVDTCLSIFW